MPESEAALDAEMESAATSSPETPIIFDHRRERKQRVIWAWGTSIFSKIATIAVQLLAVPVVFRALGEGGYAAYAAVTASAGLISLLNLGIGGSLVTPLAAAVVKDDKRRQAELVQAGLGPLLLFFLLGTVLILPLVAVLPLQVLLGRIGVGGNGDLRAAVLVAVVGTLAAVPLSAILFLRQAYQEMHISNLLGGVFNIVLCIAFLLAAARSTRISVFVAIFVLVPLLPLGVNLAALFGSRGFLLKMQGRFNWSESRVLLADGMRFLGAGLSNMLIYNWPVYWIARTLPASQSSHFALLIQATILPLGFIGGFLLPLWPLTADAVARGDSAWIAGNIRKGRAVIAAGGVVAFLVCLLLGNWVMRQWLHKPIAVPWQVAALVGLYMPLAIWEYFHFILAMGFGHLRQATTAVFQRSIAFAIAVPLLARFGGIQALWCGLCISVLLWTAWLLPALCHVKLDENSMGL